MILFGKKVKKIYMCEEMQQLPEVSRVYRSVPAEYQSKQQ